MDTVEKEHSKVPSLHYDTLILVLPPRKDNLSIKDKVPDPNAWPLFGGSTIV